MKIKIISKKRILSKTPKFVGFHPIYLLRVVRDILHHSNVSTTERYLGITPQELDDAYYSLDD